MISLVALMDWLKIDRVNWLDVQRERRSTHRVPLGGYLVGFEECSARFNA